MKRNIHKRMLLAMLTASFILALSPRTAFAESTAVQTTESASESQSESESQSQTDTQQIQQQTTSVKGAFLKVKKRSRKVLHDTIYVSSPAGRTLHVQYRSKKTWKTVNNIKLPNSNDSTPRKVIVTYPNTWWTATKTKWRYTIDESPAATAYKSRTITLTTLKYYQNPKGKVKIRLKISKHGHKYYTSKVLINNASTKKQHINAMIKTAYKYLGDPYVVCRSGRPGRGVDCSGLVMQACYGAGVDLYPSTPWRHRYVEYESRHIAKHSNLKTVPFRKRKRGDLIFYSKGGTIIHIAIYLGHNRIIHSWPGRVQISNIYGWGTICKVKRIFN